MTIKSLFENRSSRRIAALLVAGANILATLPSRAETELLSLAIPSHANTSGTENNDVFSPIAAPNESVSNVARTDVTSVKVRLESVNTLEVTTIDLPLDGQLGPDDAREMAFFLRCRRTGRQRPIAPEVLAMLADVAAQWPDRTIQIVSGFRAPPYGAPHSKHFKGLAIDLRIRGVRTSRLRDYIWREHHDVGVGFYAKENFVHMDWRPGEQDRAWSGSEEGGPEEYNPRWAWKARRTLPSRGTGQEGAPMPFAYLPAFVGSMIGIIGVIR
jgi:uncharacterized protein YcbK (DUF882 family)